MGHGDTSCDPHLHQTVEQRSTTSRVASAAGRLGSSRLLATDWSVTAGAFVGTRRVAVSSGCP